MIRYNFDQKSSIDQIRAAFDERVERFSNLNTGHQAAMDSLLMMDLIASAAARTTPHARRVLDIGCGAGNYTIKLLMLAPNLECTLLDISHPMLERAEARVRAYTSGQIATLRGDIREVALPENAFDIVITGSALHHLRQDAEWDAVFAKVYRSLRRSGSFWISDLVAHGHPAIQALLWERYGQYLESVGGAEYRDAIFANIEEEDTPKSVGYQMHLLARTGFVNIEILHKQACFAALGGVKN